MRKKGSEWAANNPKDTDFLFHTQGPTQQSYTWGRFGNLEDVRGD